jgi:hypothetical protein
MTTPDGRPSTPVTARHLGVEAGDAAVQARPQGGGMFTAAGEAQVVNTNQDRGLAPGDAASGLATLRGNVANASADSAQFTREL